jgi:hypothetical protein
MRDLAVTFKNTSNKNIVYFQLLLQFPEIGAAGLMMAHPMNFGRMPKDSNDRNYDAPIIGAIAGGGKGAAIGAAVGAGTGAGSVLIQGRDELDLPSGTEVTIRASSPRNRSAQMSDKQRLLDFVRVRLTVVERVLTGGVVIGGRHSLILR